MTAIVRCHMTRNFFRGMTPTWLCALVVLVCASSLMAQDANISWHAKGWAYRAIVRVPDAAKDNATMDVAQVRLDHAGAMLANADDVRIFDLAGQAVPYQVTFQDPRRYALISFQVPSEQCYRVIYFGNKDAKRDTMRAIANQLPGTGPPTPGPDANGWIPRAGLVLSTYARPDDVPSPETLDAMNTLLTQAVTTPQGGGYRTSISDSVNPFGSSYAYVSVYRGWIKLPTSGKWVFSTASSDASFSFFDGKKLVHWPGRHQYHQGNRGEFQTTITAEAGLHFISYYHEFRNHRPMAFLGIGHIGQRRLHELSSTYVPEPRAGVVTRYETQDRRTLAVPDIQLQDTAQFQGESQIVLTRVKLVAQIPSNEKDQWQVNWLLGDGQSVRGIEAGHVYLEPGMYKVTMEAAGSQGQQVRIDWPLDVYPRVNRTDNLPVVKTQEYGPLLDAADIKKYSGDQNVILAQTLDQINHHTQAAAAAKAALFKADTSPKYLSAMLAMAYNHGAASLEESRRLSLHLKRQAARTKDELQSVQILASRVRIMGVWLRDLDEALSMYPPTETIMKASRASGVSRDATQQATLALGDAYLYAGQLDKAMAQYRLAQSFAAPVRPAAVLAVRSGMYPQQVEQQLDANKPELALEVIESWKQEVPPDAITGLPVFYEGKALLALKNPSAAIAPLELSAQLMRGSEYEAQAYWLAAKACETSGQNARAKTILRKLVSSGLTGQWVELARQTLEGKS